MPSGRGSRTPRFFARRCRLPALVDQFLRAHLQVEVDFFVHILSDGKITDIGPVGVEPARHDVASVA